MSTRAPCEVKLGEGGSNLPGSLQAGVPKISVTERPAQFEKARFRANMDKQAPESASMPTTRTFPVSDPVQSNMSEVPNQRLSAISLRAFCLGQVAAAAVLITLYLYLVASSPLWRAALFLAALSSFHFLEFWITARYNPRQATVSAFLLSSNGTAYNLAHSAALAEFLITHFFTPQNGGEISQHGFLTSRTADALSLVGICLMSLGQVARSTAMAQAGQNFNHIVQTKKNAGHQLVKHGIYAISRHPSYFGFFWWGLGTQLMLGNVVCFVAYSVLLWHFFARRIRKEEELLLFFFGKEYEEYKAQTVVGIPFIR